LQRPDLIKGDVDVLNRPFVKLDMRGFSEPLTAFIDTGFNGAMILDEYQAERIGLRIAQHHFVETMLASQRHQAFLLCKGFVTWMGEEVFVSALVIMETEAERLVRRRPKRVEDIVLGVELLLNCRLEIDFTTRSVTIARLA
jgi:predicted aspartyl protease